MQVSSQVFRIQFLLYEYNFFCADFWLRGYLKERVFLMKPNSINELKESITENIPAIPADLLRAAVYSIEERLLLVLEENGGHIQHLR